MTVTGKNRLRQSNAAEYYEDSASNTNMQQQLVKEQNLLDVFTTLNDSVKIREQFLDCIQSLLVRHRGKGRYPERAAILTALTMMQNNRDLLKILDQGKNSLQRSWLQGIQDFTQVLVRASVGSVNPTHIAMITAVKKAYERLYSDQRLSPVFKTLISQLQFPLLKLAFLDKLFLQKDTHPASMVLRKLIQAGSRWSNVKDFRADAEYVESIHVVSKIIDEFVDDNAVFDEIIQQSGLFNKEMLPVPQASSAVVATAAEAGQEAVDAAAASSPVAETAVVDPVSRLVNEMIAGHDLPQDVRQFLTGTWRMIMTKSRRQYGEQHVVWRMAVDVIERVVWCYQPKPSMQDKDMLRSMFPKLLLDIEDGLRTIMHNRREKESLFALLMQKYTMHLTEIYRYK